MNFLKLPKDARFTNKFILLFLLPIIFEQMMLAVMSLADTFMVSSLGETAVAGVALINRIDNFAKQFFLAFAQGGSVVISQYIGAKNDEMSSKSLKSNIRIVFSIGLLVMAVMVIFKTQIINLFFGSADKEVIAVSQSYFSITALSYPFTALYYSCSAAFRAFGESRIPFIASICMMSINLIIKYISIYHLNFGITGAALSTFLAMTIMGIFLLCLLHRQKNKVQLKGLFKFDFNGKMAVRILNISFPNGIEQAMFQLGALLLASLTSSLGTAAIAADQISRVYAGFLTAIGAACNATMMFVVGNCMGAGKPDEASFYAKHVLKIDYLITFSTVVLFGLFLKPFIAMYNLSFEAERAAMQIIVMYSIGTTLYYPSSFALPSALRGAGDTKFVMLVASLSMFILRIGSAYLIVHVFNAGVLGIWIAMQLDWIVRTIIFAIRFAYGKWKNNKVI